MSHDRDRDHAPPTPDPRDPREALTSRRKPDCRRHEHPTPGPHEPIDPKGHPNRWPRPFNARPT
jgi:hypothetical protein